MLFVEGEKTAEAAAALFPDFSATTSSGGCKAHQRVDYSPLKGRDVVIWPDQDEPGRAFAEAIAQHSTDVGAASIKIVDVPRTWPRGWDLADEPPSDSVDLREFIDDAKEWQPPAADVAEPSRNAAHAPAIVSKTINPVAAFPAKSLFDIKFNLNAKWLIKSILPAKAFGVIYGAPGTGKSFFTLDAMLYVAAGRDWAGCRTKPGVVVYVAAEGQGGFENRVAAARDELKMPASAKFLLILTAPNLGIEKGDAATLVQAIQAQLPKDWPPVDIIVIDTLSRTMFGSDENGPEGMGSFIANAGYIGKELGSGVLAVHHKGKDEARGMRGWSGLHGACDFEWEVTVADGKHSVTIPKMKDGPDGLSWDFELVSRIIGEDDDGDDVTTCLVALTSVPMPGGRAKVARKKGRKKTHGAFDSALNDALYLSGIVFQVGHDRLSEVKAVKLEQVRPYFEVAYPTGEDPKKRQKAVREAWRVFIRNLPAEYGHESRSDVEYVWRIS